MENKGGQNTENQAAITVLLASEHQVTCTMFSYKQVNKFLQFPSPSPMQMAKNSDIYVFVSVFLHFFFFFLRNEMQEVEL